jgi:anti-sigma B factor antagonist
VGLGPNFRIATFQCESGTTIKLAGELDGATSPELLACVERLAADPGVRSIAVDLAEVSFIDSAGMRAIIAIERTTAERELALTIVRPPDEVTELLRIAGVADHLTLTPVLDAPPPSQPFLERIEIELEREHTAPGRARRELREALAGRIPDSDCATLTLLTSEVVTNAVIHPQPGVGRSVGLRITTFPDRVRVEVSDAGAGFELHHLPSTPRETGGHGLIVVDGLSSRWGTIRDQDGEGERFCVWFELDVAFQPESEREGAETTDPRLAALDG